MIVTALLISFCLLVSTCFSECLFLSKLMKRLKWHRKYVIEFLSIRDSKGLSIEKYLLKDLFPKYLSFLLFVFLTVALMNILPFFSPLIKGITTVLGLLSCSWIRFYNKSFFSLLWNTVLSKVE